MPAPSYQFSVARTAPICYAHSQRGGEAARPSSHGCVGRGLSERWLGKCGRARKDDGVGQEARADKIVDAFFFAAS